MTTVHVNASVSYDVVIGRSLIQASGEMIRPLVKGNIAAIVSDSNVYPLYGDTVRSSLEGAGFQVHTFVFPAGEESKCMSTYASLLNFLAENRLSRKDLIVALGGGVVGDLAGFAAATYLRGIDFVQIPTTLLAATDSSVGGKTGIDLDAGKNLCGAFHQPRLVICDTDTLTTLSADMFKSGMAEVIKYGVIRDGDFFNFLENDSQKIISAYREGDSDGILEDVIATCVKIKRDVVEEDEFEGGVRAILNFGHTAAHAIENLSGYKVPHGLAVSAGMYISMNYAERIGVSAPTDTIRLYSVLSNYGMPIFAESCANLYGIPECDMTPEKMADTALSDKKASGGYINLVIPTGIGSCRIDKTPTEKLYNFMKSTD